MEGAFAGFQRSGPSLKDGRWHRQDPRPLVPHRGRFITTASISLAVTLAVEELPGEGAELRAQTSVSTPGGGYIVAAGVRAQGVPVWVASPLGTGPNSSAVRRSLAVEDIGVVPGSIVGDIGVGVTMVQDDGRTATVLAPGVEAEHSQEQLEGVELAEGDLVHISGSDLATPSSAQVVCDWVETLPEFVTVVVETSPGVKQVSAGAWAVLLGRADVLTMNIREARALQSVLGEHVPGSTIRSYLRSQAAVVRRTGPMGCELQTARDQPVQQVPALATRPVDTSGVGDTHVAVMCAALLQGKKLLEACRRANAGAAIEISHPTSFPLPTKEEVDRVVELGEVPEDLQVTP